MIEVKLLYNTNRMSSFIREPSSQKTQTQTSGDITISGLQENIIISETIHDRGEVRTHSGSHGRSFSAVKTPTDDWPRLGQGLYSILQLVHGHMYRLYGFCVNCQ